MFPLAILLCVAVVILGIFLALLSGYASTLAAALDSLRREVVVLQNRERGHSRAICELKQDTRTLSQHLPRRGKNGRWVKREAAEADLV